MHRDKINKSTMFVNEVRNFHRCQVFHIKSILNVFVYSLFRSDKNIKARVWIVWALVVAGCCCCRHEDVGAHLVRLLLHISLASHSVSPVFISILWRMHLLFMEKQACVQQTENRSTGYDAIHDTTGNGEPTRYQQPSKKTDITNNHINGTATANNVTANSIRNKNL